MSTPDLRASDADRDELIGELREHTALGRLTLEEFSDRVERAVGAGTLSELENLRRDLPAARAAPGRRPRRLTAVIFGSVERTGRWRLPRSSFAFVVFSNLDLDLRQAEMTGPVASVTALVLFGNIDVYVPEGVESDLGGLAIGGHRREWGTELPPRGGAPLVRVHVVTLFGTADLWRVPAAWVGRTFRETIKGLRRGEHRELPPGA